MEEKYITLAHGAGGAKSQELVEQVMLPAFDNEFLRQMHDGARLNLDSGKIAMSTDTYVVQPLFFAGGNIGKLAVCGTVNDLAMTGAVPKYLSVGMVLEAGLPIDDLKEITKTMRKAADEAGVFLVTGDTKVVGKGSCDGIFINTAGVGELIAGADISPLNVKEDMDIIVSGTLGDHAATIMSKRHSLELPADLKSDCAPLNHLVKKLLTAVPQIAVLRDATRGGVAAVLNEIASQAKVGILLEEESLPITPAVRGFCEILGFEPLNLANEGKFVLFVPPQYTEKILSILHADEYGKNACKIGTTNAISRGEVAMRTPVGGVRIVDMPAGEQIPRIC